MLSSYAKRLTEFKEKLKRVVLNLVSSEFSLISVAGFIKFYLTLELKQMCSYSHIIENTYLIRTQQRFNTVR